MAKLNDEGKLLWIIPDTINLSQLLAEHPPGNFEPIDDHFYFILDYIYSQMEFTDLDETVGYVNVNAEKLKEYNYYYKKYLDYLKRDDVKVLISDKYFILGEKSTGYFFSDKYLSEKSQTVIATWDTLIQRVKKNLRKQHDRQEETKANYPFLTKWFNPNLKIHEQQAYGLIERLYPLPVWKNGIRGNLRGRPKPKVQRLKANRLIKKFANNEFYCYIDENIGRCHTNLTNLKKELRQHIKYDARDLVNVDIANSQPLFSALLLKKEFYEGKLPLSINNISSVKRLFKSTNKYKEIIKEAANYITLVNSSINQSCIGFDQFRSMAESGDFYRIAFNKMLPGEKFNKELIKRAILQTYFSGNQFIGQPEARLKSAFQQAFPEVYEIFKILKRHDKVILSHILQRIESFIIIDGVAKRIADESPQLPFYTIHDSILTTEGNEDFVAEIIRDEINKWTGLKAHIRIEQ